MDVAGLDEFGAQLYLGPMAPMHSTDRSQSTVKNCEIFLFLICNNLYVSA